MTLESLFVAVESVLPVLQGRVATGPAPDPAGLLVTFWRHAEPAAGPHFWAAQPWCQLVWQPAYLSVLTLHLTGGCPDLHGLQQTTHEGLVAGYALAPQTVAQPGADAGLAVMASGLRAWTDATLASLRLHQPLAPRLAHCLAMDCVQSALLLVRQAAGWSNDELLHWSHRWSTALGWPRHGALVLVPSAAGAVPMLQRAACCQYFRARGATECSTCPRRPLSQRQGLAAGTDACFFADSKETDHVPH